MSITNRRMHNILKEAEVSLSQSNLTKATQDALAELEEKDMKMIQVETAEKWCGRALAARMMGLAERDVTEFAHEAIEHAALSGDEYVLRAIRIALEEFGIET